MMKYVSTIPKNVCMQDYSGVARVKTKITWEISLTTRHFRNFVARREGTKNAINFLFEIYIFHLLLAFNISCDDDIHAHVTLRKTSEAFMRKSKPSVPSTLLMSDIVKNNKCESFSPLSYSVARFMSRYFLFICFYLPMALSCYCHIISSKLGVEKSYFVTLLNLHID